MIVNTMIEVLVKKNFDNINLSQADIENLVKAICLRFDISDVTVSIAIVDNDEMKALNKKFLNRTTNTDCLSFELSDTQSAPQRLFEIIVNGEMAVSQADSRQIQPKAELALYITHGMLHNLDFDDANKNDAKKMHDTEDEILQQLGFGLVYNKNKTDD